MQLWSDGYYATPGLHWDANTLTGHPFFYFAYGAAVSEVVVDTHTGEARVLRADLLHDVGRSLNPAIDIGQIEGGFVQGMGWLTTEELVWHPSSGALMTHAPSTYKIPTAHDVPDALHVALFENERSKANREVLNRFIDSKLNISPEISAIAQEISHKPLSKFFSDDLDSI